MLVNHIKASNKSILCDLVIKNVTIVDVFNKADLLTALVLKTDILLELVIMMGQKL